MVNMFCNYLFFDPIAIRAPHHRRDHRFRTVGPGWRSARATSKRCRCAADVSGDHARCDAGCRHSTIRSCMRACSCRPRQEPQARAAPEGQGDSARSEGIAFIPSTNYDLRFSDVFRRRRTPVAYSPNGRLGRTFGSTIVARKRRQASALRLDKPFSTTIRSSVSPL